MSKTKIVLLITVITISIAGAGVGIYLSTLNPKDIDKSDAKTGSSYFSPTPKTEPVNADLTYKDESGFSFSYPKSYDVKDATPNDAKYYSMVKMSKLSKSITVSVLDTTHKTPDEWVKNDTSAPKDSSLYGAVKLANMSAKQYSDTTNLYTVAVDSGVLYLIQGPKDGEVWEDVQSLIVKSFSIGSANSSKSQSPPSSGDIIYEEEVVE